MNDKELQDFIRFLLMKNEIDFFDFSLRRKIEIFEEFFTSFGKAIEQKEENEKAFLRFLKIIKELGPQEGSKVIYVETRNDEYWTNFFQHFLGTGVLNVHIMTTFLSVNKEMREKEVAVLNEVNKILNNLKMLEQKENN